MYFRIKRLTDIVCAIIGIVVFSPVILIASLFIKSVSPEGSIFVDSKPRVGKDGKEFKMYKLRTMRPNAQKWLETQPELYKRYQENGYKLDPDPRLLKGGKFIRKYSIDEMPQFFNVLKGEMSVVGPRAYFKYELEEQEGRYPHTKDYIKQALTTKPGLTGPWQIGGRSNVNFEERIKMDSEYASRHSVLYDLIILLKTPYVVITGSGAV
ncbi:sugar transferase [Candidatus Nomurabacteria bacterium]|uniref:Sugar transferase n=1 Tax=candidate division WWE3 bacterium TaxID=2053526 RepID=A0A955IWV8_UNCKA|nr:sugar transferase [candidate division WWE3 bacterium]MCB9824127.1 sugar transferase [Candidatus Nomurabacteria bacterium]MCB9826902.1 sugar transferase [Candidatus Nomurabacteria bacterium]MCB9828068.1 sugar transferase [Candidatus Nomurabacteria bacterium]